MTDAEKQAMGQSGNQTPEVYEVEVNGEKVKLGIDDLKKGYMMQSDYTRKTQELSTKQKEIDRLVEEKAIELWKEAQEAEEKEKLAKSGEQDNKGQESELAKLTKRQDQLEQQIHEGRQTVEQERYTVMLEKTISELQKKYTDMDADKVMLKFYRESNETEPIDVQFEKFAKESHEQNQKFKQSIIDGYVKEKSSPKKLGEIGSGNTPGGANNTKPPKSFDEAKEMALKMVGE